MPMIDVYAATDTFGDRHRLAIDLATAVMSVEKVPDIPMFRQNTAAFVHDLPSDALANVDGDHRYVRVQVLTNQGALDRDQQLEVVRRLTDIVADAAGDPGLAQRTWVLLTEAARRRLGPPRPREHQRRAGHRRTGADRRADGRATGGLTARHAY